MRRHSSYREKIRGWTARIISIQDDSGGAVNVAPFAHLKGQLRLLPNLESQYTFHDDEIVELNVTFRSFNSENVAVITSLGVGGFIIWSGNVYSRTETDRKKWLEGITSHCYLSNVIPDPYRGSRYPEAATLCSSHPQIFGVYAELRFDADCTCGAKKVFVEGETKMFCLTCRC